MIKKITYLVCDRCTAESERSPADINSAGWGKIKVLKANGAGEYHLPAVGAGRSSVFDEADICPDCVRSIQQWWESIQILKIGGYARVRNPTE